MKVIILVLDQNISTAVKLTRNNEGKLPLKSKQTFRRTYFDAYIGLVKG